MSVKESAFGSLAAVACRVALLSAQMYLEQHDLVVAPEALEACVKSWVKLKLPEALHDAKEALACGMGQAAEATFRASMSLAGIEAAKEAGQPADSISQSV